MQKAKQIERLFDWDEYGRLVVSGKIPVCKWTRLAVERHYRDLEDGKKRGLYFCEEYAQHAIQSFLFLKHSKGEWAGQMFVPSLWQQWWVALAFGWIREDGTRRFREVWEEVPRKNGKSTKLAGIGLYLFDFDGEPGAEVYTAATKMDQAKITHDEAVRMVQSSPLLKRHIAVRRNELYIPGTANKFLPLGRDSKSIDGLNPSGSILDEVHAHKNRELYDVIKSGQGGRRQPMIWQITTAGFDLSSFGYEQHNYALEVLNGKVDDEFLAIVYTVDDQNKWDDPVEWQKANPNLGISVYEDGLRFDCDRAKRQPSLQPEFKTKRLNIWLASGTTWIPVEEWRQCANSSMKLEDFEGRDCWIGVDLAEKSDIAALCLVFPDGDKYCVFFKLYLNEYEVSKQENDHYRRYQEKNELIVTEGNVTDFSVIRSDLEEIAEKFNIREIPYDPYFAMYFATSLAESGLPMIEMSQTARNISPVITEIENLILEGRIEHDGNSMVEWMMTNVVVRESKFSGLKHATKERKANKIDGPIAMLMALNRALANESDYVTQGFIDL